MRQEHVTLQNVKVSQLYDQIKKYLQDLKLDIIHEEWEENYWDLKAHKGTKSSVIIGNVRDVEVMISGTEGNYDLILRTGAWGKDIVVPTAIVGVLTAGVAAIPAAAVSGYRAHAFEKNFWKFIKKTLSEIGSEKATMSEIVVVTNGHGVQENLGSNTERVNHVHRIQENLGSNSLEYYTDPFMNSVINSVGLKDIDTARRKAMENMRTKPDIFKSSLKRNRRRLVNSIEKIIEDIRSNITENGKLDDEQYTQILFLSHLKDRIHEDDKRSLQELKDEFLEFKKKADEISNKVLPEFIR